MEALYCVYRAQRVPLPSTKLIPIGFRLPPYNRYIRTTAAQSSRDVRDNFTTVTVQVTSLIEKYLTVQRLQAIFHVDRYFASSRLRKPILGCSKTIESCLLKLLKWEKISRKLGKKEKFLRTKRANWMLRWPKAESIWARLRRGWETKKLWILLWTFHHLLLKVSAWTARWPVQNSYTVKGKVSISYSLTNRYAVFVPP